MHVPEMFPDDGMFIFLYALMEMAAKKIYLDAINVWKRKRFKRLLKLLQKCLSFYILPGMTAYETDRGSCLFTNNSFTHALNPVSFMYCKKEITALNLQL